jgi:hypothetical protein
MALVDGKTHLTAQSGKEVRFRVVCDQLSLQAPRGTIEAQGVVKLSSTGLEGSCERLTISWQEDQVMLDGQAKLKCQRDGQNVELKSDRLSLRLSPANCAGRAAFVFRANRLRSPPVPWIMKPQGRIRACCRI